MKETHHYLMKTRGTTKKGQNKTTELLLPRSMTEKDGVRVSRQKQSFTVL